ncbi:hypothetical protein AB0L40_09165 [Patulibacter sp. NPDC049589]|uniref:hypothetical protein n=1 Tax=Patulibacter sp. NPDC049589 TaxID=3154731 RepID=UPI003448F27D
MRDATQLSAVVTTAGIALAFGLVGRALNRLTALERRPADLRVALPGRASALAAGTRRAER